MVLDFDKLASIFAIERAMFGSAKFSQPLSGATRHFFAANSRKQKPVSR
jgi:hypothetical protein